MSCLLNISGYISLVTYHSKLIHNINICNSCNMGIQDIPDMYGRAEGMHFHIRVRNTSLSKLIASSPVGIACIDYLLIFE